MFEELQNWPGCLLGHGMHLILVETKQNRNGSNVKVRKADIEPGLSCNDIVTHSGERYLSQLLAKENTSGNEVGSTIANLQQGFNACNTSLVNLILCIAGYKIE